MPRLTVGLTGGIASGKSLAARSFEELGVPVLDADLVAREVVAPGTPGLAAITAAFGPEFITEAGELDRPRMRQYVFADESALRRLEAITHPAIRRRMVEWRDAQSAPYCILSVAILVEARMRDLVDRVLVVDAPVDAQLERLVLRDGIAAELGLKIISAQAAREDRLAAADDVIVNAAGAAELQSAVRELHRFYGDLAVAGTPRAPGMHCPSH